MASLAEVVAEIVDTFVGPAATIKSLEAQLAVMGRVIKARGMPLLIRPECGSQGNPCPGDRIVVNQTALDAALNTQGSFMYPLALLRKQGMRITRAEVCSVSPDPSDPARIMFKVTLQPASGGMLMPKAPLFYLPVTAEDLGGQDSTGAYPFTYA